MKNLYNFFYSRSLPMSLYNYLSQILSIMSTTILIISHLGWGSHDSFRVWINPIRPS